GPALRRSQHDHRPSGALDDAPRPSVRPDVLDFRHDRVDHAGQLTVNHLWLASFHEVRLIAHAFEELLQLVLRDSRQKTGVGNLVAIQMENGEHTTITGRIQKLIAVPAGGQWARLRLAV